MKIFIAGLGRINTKNRDGGEIRLNEVIRRWIRRGDEVHFLLPEREYHIVKEENRNVCYHLLTDIVKSESDSTFNVLLIYFLRFLQVCFYYLHKVPKSFGLIYAPSDFLLDLIPAIIIKKRNKGSKLVACIFLVAPNPFRGYTEVFTKKRYRLPSIRQIIYFLTQRFAIFLMKYFADVVLILNKFEKEILSGYLPSDKIKVVDMGIDFNRISKIMKDENVYYDGVYLGRFHPQKGVLDLIKIWKNVCEIRKESRLAIIGGGADIWFKRLEAEIISNNLQNNVDVIGFCDMEKKIKILKSSRIFLCPSYYESWGMVICEAMACGLPVVSYSVPIFEELFPKGILKVNIGDTNLFAHAVLNLLEDKNLYEKVSKDALEVSLRYDWDKVIADEFKQTRDLLPAV